MKIFFSFLITIFLFISCNNTGERYTNLQPLSIGILLTDDYSLPPTLSKDSIGLTVNIIRFRNAAERDSAFISGKIDGMVIDFIHAVLLQQKGVPLEIVMKNDTTYQMITSIGNNITEIGELEGRNIAVEKNTIIEYVTDRILEMAEISTDTGVNKADIKKTSLRLNLLQNGLIDAAVLPGKYSEVAIDNGNSLLFSVQESDIPVIGTVFSKNAIRNKKREIEIFTEQHKTSKPSQKQITNIINWLKKKQ